MRMTKALPWALSAALGLALGGSALAETSAERAVREAQKYKGQTITIVWEAGLQSLDPLNFSAPKWKELTGMDVKVVEVATAEMFTKIMQDYRSGAGGYDALNVIPAWMPDLVQAGALENLEPYVDKYAYRDELQKIAPIFRDNWMKVNNTIYGFPDDGDVFIMYYRKDLFADADVKAKFKAKTGHDLTVPKTWKEFDETGAALTEVLKDKGIYGAAFFRQPPYAQYMFQERFRNEGGKYFGDDMKAAINSDIGVKVLTEMRNENKFMPAGVEQFGFVENLAAFMQGTTAMTISVRLMPGVCRSRRAPAAGEQGSGGVPPVSKWALDRPCRETTPRPQGEASARPDESVTVRCPPVPRWPVQSAPASPGAPVGPLGREA